MNIKEEQLLQQNKKTEYLKPTIERFSIELELGLAINSVTVNPGDSSGAVFDEWDEVNDQKTIDW